MKALGAGLPIERGCSGGRGDAPRESRGSPAARGINVLEMTSCNTDTIFVVAADALEF